MTSPIAKSLRMLIPLVLIATVAAEASAAPARDLAKEMAYLQKALPMKVDDQTTLVEVGFEDRQMLYRFAMDGDFKPLGSMDDETAIYRPAVLPIACKQWGELLASGEILAINYVWEFEGDSSVATYTAEDCEGEPTK